MSDDSSEGEPISQLPQQTVVHDTDWFVFVDLTQPAGSRTSKLAASDLGTYIASKVGFQATTGDVTINSSYVATLATVNASPGTIGSGTLVPVITVNAKGLVTGITTASVSAGGNVSNSGTPTVNQFGVWVTATTISGVSITGLVKGNGASAPTAAAAGTDYLAPPSGTAIQKANSGGPLANATAGTDYLAPPSGTAIQKANSGTGLANATAGTDYVAPATATTFTATQTFSGSSSVLAEVLTNAAEAATISATAATGTINFDVGTQSVLYYTTNASANWTLNVRFSAGTSFNTAVATGQVVTIAFAVTQGGTAFFQNGFTIDGGAITPKWQGGAAPAAGDINSIDVYSVTIIKTGSAAFTVLESMTQFK